MNNQLSKDIFQDNVAAGWWDLNNPRPDGVTLALIHSEISEALLGWLGGRQDDHLPQYLNWKIELADAAIRIYDFFGYKGWDIEKSYWGTIENTVPLGYLDDFRIIIAKLHALVSLTLESVRKNRPEAPIYLANLQYFLYSYVPELPELIQAKRDYNAQRADHKLENRAKADGKKF